MKAKTVETLDELIDVAKFVHERYREFDFIKPNKFGIWVVPAQLNDDNTIFYQKEGNDIIWTVTAVFENWPAMLNFPEEVEEIAQSGPTVEFVSLASRMKDARLFRGLIEICYFLLKEKNVQNLIIEVTEDHSDIYKLVGFKTLAIANKKHTYLNKYPVLMYFDLTKYEKMLNPWFFERFVKEIVRRSS